MKISTALLDYSWGHISSQDGKALIILNKEFLGLK